MITVLKVLCILPFVWCSQTSDHDKIAILEPSTTAVSSLGEGKSTNSIQEPASRVITKMIKEAKDKLKWTTVSFLPYQDVLAAQNSVLGESGQDTPVTRVRNLDRIATKLGARYVVSTVVRELTSYRAQSFLSNRKGGRATIHLLVYDSETKKYVWEDDRTETSIREQWFRGEGLAAMQDQALFNAIRNSLDPFIVAGKRKEVTTPTLKLVAKVVSVSKNGGSVVLDIGTASGVSVGDVLEAIDGTARIKIVEILENGSVAEIVSGVVDKDEVFRTKG